MSTAPPPAGHEESYVVGVDYGTLSGRALVVRVSDGAELGAGKASRTRIHLAGGRGEPLAQGSEQVGPGLEPVLVEVVPRTAARAQQKITFEIRVLANRAEQRRVVH